MAIIGIGDAMTLTVRKAVNIEPVSPKPSTASNAETREDGAIVRQYKGREIVKIDNRYFVDETKFSTLGKAQRAISEGKV